MKPRAVGIGSILAVILSGVAILYGDAGEDHVVTVEHTAPQSVAQSSDNATILSSDSAGIHAEATTPKFIAMTPPTPLSLWPQPLDPRFAEAIEKGRRSVWEQPIARGAISPEEMQHIHGILERFNRDLSDAFDSTVAPVLTGQSSAPENLHEVYGAKTDALAAQAEQDIQKILGTDFRFIAYAQMTPENAQKFMTYYERFVEGSRDESEMIEAFRQRRVE